MSQEIFLSCGVSGSPWTACGIRDKRLDPKCRINYHPLSVDEDYKKKGFDYGSLHIKAYSKA